MEIMRLIMQLALFIQHTRSSVSLGFNIRMDSFYDSNNDKAWRMSMSWRLVTEK